MQYSFNFDTLGANSQLKRAVTMSLFSDTSSPDVDGVYKGWWGDQFGQVPLGSRLWSLVDKGATVATANLAQHYAEEALKWLSARGIVEAVHVKASLAQNSITLTISITTDTKQQLQGFVQLCQSPLQASQNLLQTHTIPSQPMPQPSGQSLTT